MARRDSTDSPRRRIVTAAVELLEKGGPDAVSTRAVAAAAGMQPPAIYRLFGDKEGLLEAVAEHGYGQFLESKRAQLDLAPEDPVEELRRGWDLVVEFGVSRPELFAVMNRATGRGVDMAHRAGLEVLYGRVRRLAAGGGCGSTRNWPPRSFRPPGKARSPPGTPLPRTAAIQSC